MRISICLPTDASFFEINEFLQNIKYVNTYSFEIIIAHYGEMNDAFAKLENADIRYFHNKETKTQARVRAVFEATSDLLLIADTTQKICVNGLEKALQWYDNNPNAAGYFCPNKIRGENHITPVLNLEKTIKKDQIHELVTLALNKSYLYDTALMKTDLVQKIYCGKEHLNQAIALSYSLNFLGDVHFFHENILSQDIDNNTAHHFCIHGVERARVAGEWLLTRVYKQLSKNVITDEAITQVTDAVNIIYKQALQISVYFGLRYDIPKHAFLYQKLHNQALLADFLQKISPGLNAYEDREFSKFIKSHIEDLHLKSLAEIICLRMSQIVDLKGINLYGLSDDLAKNLKREIETMSDFKACIVNNADELLVDWLAVFSDTQTHDEILKKRTDINPGFCAIVEILERVLKLKDHLLNDEKIEEKDLVSLTARMG